MEAIEIIEKEDRTIKIFEWGAGFGVDVYKNGSYTTSFSVGGDVIDAIR